MALALDASSGHRTTTTANSLTWAHTNTGSNRILVVGAFTDSGADDITGVTYNAVTMTQVGKRQGPTGQWTYLYYLIAPATGANNIVASFTGTADLAGFGISFTGAKQTGQPDASVTNSGASSPGTTTLTTVADNSRAVVIFRAGAGWTASTNSTLVPNTNSGGQQASDYIGAFYTNFDKTPAGSLNMQATTAGTNWGGVMMSIAPGPNVYTLTASLGTFTLTGIVTTFHLGKSMIAGVGTFLLTGMPAAFSTTAPAGWTNLTKHNASFTNKVKNSSIWTNETKS